MDKYSMNRNEAMKGRDEPVETTSFASRGYRTHTAEKSDRPLYEIFNELCGIPEKEIDLQDGRILTITEWHPHGTLNHLTSNIIPVSIQGYIRAKREDEKSDGSLPAT